MTDYKLTIEGDATLEHNAVPDDCHMNFYTVKWSDEARSSGTGRATVKMVHPDFPDAPHLFELTLGGFHLRARTDQWMGAIRLAVRRICSGPRSSCGKKRCTPR